MYQLIFYVPKSHINEVKTAVFAADAGRLGQYENCCWQVEGCGQFKPLEGSEPFIGRQGKLESVIEYRIEMIVPNKSIHEVIDALKVAHPYETPAYHVIECVDI